MIFQTHCTEPCRVILDELVYDQRQVDGVDLTEIKNRMVDFRIDSDINSAVKLLAEDDTALDNLHQLMIGYNLNRSMTIEQQAYNHRIATEFVLAVQDMVVRSISDREAEEYADMIKEDV